MKILLAIIFSLMTTNVFSAELTLTEVMQGVCKITASSNVTATGQEFSSGTGTVVLRDGDIYNILTNAHVVREKGQIVTLNFFVNDGWSASIPGVVSWRFLDRNRPIDVAIIQTNTKFFKTFKPRVIPLAPKKYVVSKGTSLYGAGCPQGYWVQGWRSKTLGVSKGAITFNMPPLGGQSGSSILSTVIIDKEPYSMVSGLLAWRDDSNMTGKGINLQMLYKIINGDVSTDFVIDNNFIPVSTGVCSKCGRPANEHKSGIIDNYLYDKLCPTCEKHGWTYNQHVQHGWHDCPDGQCNPFRRRRPRPQPEAPPLPIEGDLGGSPNIGNDGSNLGEGPTSNNAIIDKLKADKAQLEVDKKAIEDKLRVTINDKDVIQTTNKTLEEEKTGLLDKIGGLTGKVTDLKSQLEEHKKKAESFLDDFAPDFLGGKGLESVGLAGIALGLGAYLWHIFGLPWLSKRFGRLPMIFIRKFGNSKLQKLLENSKKKDENPEEPRYNIDEEEEDVVAVSHPITIENNQNTPAPVTINNPAPVINIPSMPVAPVATSEPISIVNTVTVGSPYVEYMESMRELAQAKIDAPDDYFKEFFNNKEKDGEPFEYWLRLGPIYISAINLLKQGKLYNKPSLSRPSQRKAAEAIIDFVNHEMYEEYTKTPIDVDNQVYATAYTGFLYKEAVLHLKSGGFATILNSKDIAEAISKFVERKWLKVVGGPIQ